MLKYESLINFTQQFNIKSILFKNVYKLIVGVEYDVKPFVMTHGPHCTSGAFGCKTTRTLFRN